MKNIEDISIVKKYFSRIFTILSKDVRKKLMMLNIPENEKKELKKELAFLNKEDQFKYLD